MGGSSLDGPSVPAEWLDEIDLDPARPWRQMATRALGDRPWLVADSFQSDELALKAQLLAERHSEVFAALDDTERAGGEVLDLVDGDRAAAAVELSPEWHPLERAARRVQEDLCLLRRASTGWILVAGSVCFPSRWRLGDKIGLPLHDVHEPVEGYRRELAARVDGLFDRLGSQIVWRRNWFIHPDPRLFQPDRPVGGDPVVSATTCLGELYLRSERQTMRKLARSQMVLFTIRIQQVPLARLASEPERRRALHRFVTDAPQAVAGHRGLSPAQCEELAIALSASTPSDGNAKESSDSRRS